MKIDLTISGLAEARAQLVGFSERRLNAAVATALTRTAVEVRGVLQSELPRVFDRPTPYTQRQLRYIAASASNLVAEVGFDIAAISDISGNVTGFRALGGDTPASKYLGPNVYGTARNVKRFERAMQAAGYLPTGWVTVPGPNAKLDAYGNVSRGQIIQILSQLRVTWTLGHKRNMALPTDKRGQASARAAVKRAGGRYFVIPVGQGKGKTPGVYLRDIGTGYSGGKSHALLVLVFVRPPVYSKRLDFDGIAQREAAARLVPHIKQAITESAARLAAKV